LLRSALVHRTLVMLSFLGVLPAAPARADAPAGRPHEWSLSTRASAEADHSAAGSQGALTVALDALARRTRAPFLGSTGGALWLGAGGAAPGLGATHWSRVRVYGVEAADDTLQVSFSSFDVRHRLDWHGKPALSSPRALWRRPYTRVSGGLSARMLGLATSSWTADIFGLGFDAGQVRQHDGPLAAVRNQISMDFVFFGLHGSRKQGPEFGPDFAIDLLAGTSRGVAGEAWSSVGSFDFVRLQGVRFADAVFADFSIGVAGTNVLPLGVPEDSADPGAMPMDDHVAEKDAERPLGSITAVRGRIQSTRGTITAAVAGHRDAHLTFDGEPALEHRVASEVSWSGSDHAVAVEAFAALTEVWLDTTHSESDVTGGVSGTWQRRLADGWVLDLSVEAARSFYASLAGAATPEAELGARATAQLSRQFGSRL
jgi:hypothetical protein